MILYYPYKTPQNNYKDVPNVCLINCIVWSFFLSDC